MAVGRSNRDTYYRPPGASSSMPQPLQRQRPLRGGLWETDRPPSRDSCSGPSPRSWERVERMHREPVRVAAYSEDPQEARRLSTLQRRTSAARVSDAWGSSLGSRPALGTSGVHVGEPTASVSPTKGEYAPWLAKRRRAGGRARSSTDRWRVPRVEHVLGHLRYRVLHPAIRAPILVHEHGDHDRAARIRQERHGSARRRHSPARAAAATDRARVSERT